MCGYGFDRIDAMTMADFDLLSDYWRDHPPLHFLMAAYLGLKKQPARSSLTEDLVRLLGADPERGGVMRLL